MARAPSRIVDGPTFLPQLLLASLTSNSPSIFDNFKLSSPQIAACYSDHAQSELEGNRDANINLCKAQHITIEPIFSLAKHIRNAIRTQGENAQLAENPKEHIGQHKNHPKHYSKGSVSSQPSISIAAVTRMGYAPGYKNDNQDACLVVQPFISQNALVGVADGHGIDGHLVSDFIRRRVPGVLLNHLDQGLAPSSALIQTFETVDSLLGKQSEVDVFNSGSTLVLALLHGKQLTTAWAGDSRAVIGKRVAGEKLRWKAQVLSEDHKPELPVEHRRITAAGGVVGKAKDGYGIGVGPHRVWLPHTDYPGLAMSRAIGDLCARNIGVVCTPDVRIHKLSSDDDFLVLATDGVWDYLSNEQVVNLIGNMLYTPNAPSRGLSPCNKSTSRTTQSSKRSQDDDERPLYMTQGRDQDRSKQERSTLNAGDSQESESLLWDTCSTLVNTARDKWVHRHSGGYIDDITAVIVQFHGAQQNGYSDQACKQQHPKK